MKFYKNNLLYTHPDLQNSTYNLLYTHPDL